MCNASYGCGAAQSGRDCFEIFAAVVQSKFADVINTVPRMGAV